MSFLITGGACALSGLLVWTLVDLFAPVPDIGTPRYLVAKRELDEGLPVTLKDLSFRQLDPGTICPTALTDQELDFASGAVLKSRVAALDPICASNLDLSARLIASSRIPRGHRGFVFRPMNRVPTQAGNVVDILIHPESEHELPHVAVSQVTVLQVLSNRKRSFIDLFVTVPVKNLPELEKAAEKGRLSIALRNPEDPTSEESRRSLKDTRNRRKKSTEAVEIISEGE